MTQSSVMPSMDFETYSEAGYNVDPTTGVVSSQGRGGLGAVGTAVYAEHPSTEVLCLYYDLKDSKGIRGWMPGTPAPVDLIQHIESGKPIEAHNVTFEFWIWNMVCVRRYGWPVLKLEQCYCSMAKARRHSLPGALGNLAKVLGTIQKEPGGGRLISKLCRPLSTKKNRPQTRWTPTTAWDDFVRLYDYCGKDVAAEDSAVACIPDLTDYERRTWIVDQTINARGVQVDVQCLDACIGVMRDMTNRYTDELIAITGGAVKSVAEVAKLRNWLARKGLSLPDLRSDTITGKLKRFELSCDLAPIPDLHSVDIETIRHLATLPPEVRRALEIRSTLAGTNIKKLPTLKMQLSSDGRLRNQYMYCGADRTGRWSAGGVQLQNITSKGPKTHTCGCGRTVGDVKTCPDDHESPNEHHPLTVNTGWNVEAVEQGLSDMRKLDFSELKATWGDPSALLAGCLRGLFVAKPGHRFICCDFSAIEAVVAACLSRCQWRIDTFSSHGKIYEQSAANATGISLAEILRHKKDTGQDHLARKTIGKVRELAGGYGGWINAWKNFGADKFMSDVEIKADVLNWRKESPEIVEMWGGQFRWCGPGKWDYRPELFGLEGMAILATLNPGKCYHHIDVSYRVHNDVLYCRLPSGRFLCYHRPRLVGATDKLNRGPCYKITFEGHNSNAAKGPVGWHTAETYGGRLFENVVQAVSADIQAETLCRLEDRHYPVVMHTHDEAVCEVPYGYGSVAEMIDIFSQRPQWASWWPLRAAGWEHQRYQKG